MFRPKRPISGPFVLLAAVTSLALSGLVGCAKKPSEDSWRMTPPTFELLDAKEGKIQRLEYSKMNSGLEPVFANETAVLRFAVGDSGLSMKIKSQCESGSEKTAEHTAMILTSESLSVLTFVPPTVLRPDSLKKEWNCNLKAQVMNANGSTQGFAISSFKLNLISTSERINSTAAKQLSDGRGVRNSNARRLICPSWWTDVPAGDDLASVVRSEKVYGIDTRETERQPLCSVIELSLKPQIVGFYSPNLGSATLSWTTENLVTVSGADTLLRRPLLAWTVKNDGTTAQIGFIAMPTSVRASVLAQYNPNAASWSKLVSTRPVFSVEGTEFRVTSQGLYFSLPPKKAVRVTMTSNYQHTICPYNKVNLSHVMLKAETSVRLMTLANPAQIANVINADPANLDAAPRDVQTPGASDLLSTLVLKAAPGSDLLALTNLSFEQAKTLGPEVGSGCIHADFDPGINIDAPPVPAVID